MTGGKACQLGSTLRTRRTVVRKCETMLKLKAREEDLQTQQAKEDNFCIQVNTCARISDTLWDIYYTNIFLILILIYFNCNWVETRWQ